MAISDDKIITISKAWIKEFVIRYQLCPFASKVYDNDEILYQHSGSTNLLKQMQSVITTCGQLSDSMQYTTAFVIIPEIIHDFEAFLDLMDRLEWALEELQLNDRFQLAGFHPDYLFENTDNATSGNYTNRSPYPMVHILDVTDVKAAIDSHPDIDSVPADNIKKLENLGVDELAKMLKRFTNASE